MSELIPVTAETRAALFPNRLARRGLKPIEVLGARREHGTRLRYMAGCKCMPCRRANSQYEAQRQAARRRGEWNGIVDAGPARRYLRKLSRLGVGKWAVVIATDLGVTCIQEIKNGTKKRCRAMTLKKILAVTAADAKDGACVDGRPTLKLIRKMLTEGYTKTRIAAELGYKQPSLQFRERVSVRNAWRVEKLYHRLMD